MNRATHQQLSYIPFPEELVEELDELTYRRYRFETNQSQSFTSEGQERLREIVQELWDFPKPKRGDIVAESKLEEIIGKGAFGTVWKAKHMETGELRAVKIFDSDRLGDGLAVHLFRRGIKAMLYLRGQIDLERSSDALDPEIPVIIVQIREIEEHLLAFAMDFIPGRDLSCGYVRGRTIEEKLAIFKRLARAVHYAHSRPETIVHRDLKPQNIVMNGSIPTLTDFDIADMAFAKTLSRRAVGGAFSYAAPEQLSEECGSLEIRSDIYSLGRLLHFFLLEKDPPMLIELIPSLEDLNDQPEGLVKIIRKCTYRSLELRYENIEQLLQALEDYKHPEKVGAYGPNRTLAEEHWHKALFEAKNKNWKNAFRAGQEALRYIDGVSERLVEVWSHQILAWQVQQGEYRLLPKLARAWFQSLSTPIALLLLIVLLSPLLYPLFKSSKQVDLSKQVKNQLINYLQDKTPQQYQAKLSISYFKGDPTRLYLARKQLAHLLPQMKGHKACRVLQGMYTLAPISKFTLPLRNGATIRMRNIYNMTKGILGDQKEHGDITCPEGKLLPGMLFSQKDAKLMLSMSLPKADLRFIMFRTVGFKKLDLTRSNLRYSEFTEINMPRAKCVETDFSFSKFRVVTVGYNNCRGALFRYAHFERVNFRDSDFRFADFRGATFVNNNFRYIEFTGSLHSSTALPSLRRQKFPQRHLNKAICLSEGLFYMKGTVDHCFEWHKYPFNHSFWKKKPKPIIAPKHCPQKLEKEAMFISYPPGELEKEGVCPWRKKDKNQLLREVKQLLNQQPKKQTGTSSRPTSKPSPKK